MAGVALRQWQGGHAPGGPLQTPVAAMEESSIQISSPDKEGWLQKQSRHLKRWKQRWIVLENAKLYSFKEKRVYANPTEVIDLRVFTSVKSSEASTNRPHSFDVYSAEYAFSMVAEDEQSKEGWIRAIGRAIVMSRTNNWQDDPPNH